jgi:hypothetical protein
VELQWEETVHRDLLLIPKAKLLLRIVDEVGDPLPDWQITVHYRSVWPSAVTDARGEVQFEDFDEGKYTVLVLAPSDREESHHVYAALGVDDLATGDSFHAIQIPRDRMPTARIRARILDSEGRVPEATTLSIEASVLRRPQWGNVTLDDRGYAESGLLPPGTYKLTVMARDHSSMRLGQKILNPNEVLDLGEIRVGR